MYSTTDFRRGLKIEIDGTPYEIVEFQHFKPGKGGAMVRTKLRNILNGRVVDNTFRSGEKVGKPDMEQRDMQFLYRQDDELIFMDMTTYEQLQVSTSTTSPAEVVKQVEQVETKCFHHLITLLTLTPQG